MERHFQEELDHLKQQLLSMGAKVEQNIADALRALRSRDRALAQDIRRRDPEVDLLEIQIDEFCLFLLALRQPVARDLRFVATALKIVKDLERIGDMAADIAQRALAVLEDRPLKPLPEIDSMSASTLAMLRGALDSFVNQDVQLAGKIIRDDDLIDQLHEQVVQSLIQLMVTDTGFVAAATHLIYVSKYLERIGDHSSNIAEMVVFMVEGKDIRHFEKIKGLRPPS